MRRVALAVLLAIVVVAAAGCSRADVHAGRVEIAVERGSRVLLGGRGQPLEVITGRHRVARGAQLKVISGAATVAVGDATLEVRGGSEVNLGDPVSLVSRDLLVTSGAHPLPVEVAGSQVSVDGVARLTRDLAVSAATYKGTVTVRSAARALSVPALRQVEVPALGVLPSAPEALNYSAADAWDRRYLSTAMELSDQLESRSRGFTSSLGAGEGHTVGFYRLLLPALEHEPAFGEQFLADTRSPGDTLVGAAIVVRGTSKSFAERWAEVFGFRSEGATWGLVALDQRVTDVSGLVGAVDQAIGAQSFTFEQAARPAPVAPAPAPEPAPAAPEPVAAPPARPTTPQHTTPAPTTPPTTAPLVTLPTIPPLIESPPADQPGLLTPLLTTVTSTVGATLGGLLGAK